MRSITISGTSNICNAICKLQPQIIKGRQNLMKSNEINAKILRMFYYGKKYATNINMMLK